MGVDAPDDRSDEAKLASCWRYVSSSVASSTPVGASALRLRCDELGRDDGRDRREPLLDRLESASGSDDSLLDSGMGDPNTRFFLAVSPSSPRRLAWCSMRAGEAMGDSGMRTDDPFRSMPPSLAWRFHRPFRRTPLPDVVTGALVLDGRADSDRRRKPEMRDEATGLDCIESNDRATPSSLAPPSRSDTEDAKLELKFFTPGDDVNE